MVTGDRADLSTRRARAGSKEIVREATPAAGRPGDHGCHRGRVARTAGRRPDPGGGRRPPGPPPPPPARPPPPASQPVSRQVPGTPSGPRRDAPTSAWKHRTASVTRAARDVVAAA